MKLYPVVKNILIKYPDTRDSYKKLLWEVWRELGYLNSGALYYSGLMKRGCPTFESVTRASRYVKIDNPTLRGNKDVLLFKKKKQSTKGTFAYREEVKKEYIPQYDSEGRLQGYLIK